jgi:hypothetical protein
VIQVVVAAVGLVIIWTIGGEAETTKSLIAKVAATLAITLLVPGVFLWKLISVPAAIDSEIREELARLRIPEGGPLPDWTMRELFLHLRPEPTNELKPYEAIGKDVLDKVSTGHLTLWGREKLGDDWSSLYPIAPSHVKRGEFTYFFLLDDDEATHLWTRVGSDERKFGDLRVNRSEALRLWPGNQEI